MLQNAIVAQHAIANPVLADVTIDASSHTQIIPLSGKTHDRRIRSRLAAPHAMRHDRANRS
jgi:hypothetical protein